MKTFAASNKTLLSNAALGVVGVALVSTMVVRASSAAFTGKTENAANSRAAGTVTLTDSKNGTALFTATNMRPGNTDTKCIEVTYTGSRMPGEAIKIHGVVTDTNAGAGETGTAAKLSDDLDMVVTMHQGSELCGATTATGATTVFNNNLFALPADYTNGPSTTWLPTTTGEKRAFTIKYTLGTDTLNDAQGDAATAKFVWEASSLEGAN